MRKKRCGIFFANGIGDYLMTLPSMRALSKALPCSLYLVTEEGSSDFIFEDVGFDKVVKVPMARPSSWEPREFSAETAAKSLGDVDCFISIVPWYSASLGELARLVQPAWSIGLDGEFDFCVGLDPRMHTADRAFNLVKKFDANLSMWDFTDPISLSDDVVYAAKKIREAVGRKSRLIVVQEETATAQKMWLPSRWEETLTKLVSEYPDLFVIVASRRPPSFSLEKLGSSAISIQNISLPFFFALIAEADLFLGIDSAGIHAADLWGTPAIGLFGTTRPEEWGFRFSENNAHIDGKGSLGHISVEDLVKAARSFLIK